MVLLHVTQGITSVKRKILILLLGSAFSLPVTAQTQATPLITHAIDGTKVVTLRGNVHPLAQARFDVGSAPASTPARRLLLLLNRPPDREAALAAYMQDVHLRGSATYHQWLTPEEFGARFGPDPSDIQQLSNWLSRAGFQVMGVSKSKALIEFSGTVGQVNNAFNTQIHKYAVNGEVHYANATDPQIPEALAGIVRGVSSLNDFRPKSELHVVGSAHLNAATRKISPDFTLSGQSGQFYGIAPEDFATQYDLKPLYAAGLNGNGETIGIINDSNIDVNLDSTYRGLFHLSSNPAQVVLDGGDPGMNADDTEAYLDVELAGAVAPAATVNLYIAAWDTQATAQSDPLILAAIRAIEDNQADVLSVSFGQCEAYIGATDNAILAALWEQAAAQGQTVIVAAGDSGSAGCDNPTASRVEAIQGLAVNGFASTPWNVAMGGTDFYYSDYANGAPSAATLWNATNDANLGSMNATLPEQVWNDAYGFNVLNPNNPNPSGYLYNIDAGSGGASGCLNSSASAQGSAVPFVCNPVSAGIYGYAKPSWQSLPGVPSDGVRDLPDLSLFSANGDNLSAYIICASPGDCVSNSNQIQVSLVGGTSAAAPAMAGIMAIVDQKYGRQGQADYMLYPLAQQKPSAFHAVTRGGNNVPCAEGSPDCVLGTNSNPILKYTLSGYPATVGYNLASGIGSIDANVLVSNWDAINLAPSTTSLQLSATSFMQGTPVTVTTSVDSSSGSTPQGGVSILTNSLVPSGQSLDLLTLGSQGSASGSIDSLPGGTYQVWANYGGDSLHAASHSSPVTLTVSPKASAITITARSTYSATHNPATVCTPVVGQYATPIASGSSIWLGEILWLSVQPSGSTPATGSVTFTLDGHPASVPLNALGIATWTPPLLNAGSHSVTATYSGDASYTASTSLPFTFTVTQYPTTLGLSPGGTYVSGSGTLYNAYAGDNYPVEFFVRGGSCILPTGTVTLSLGSQTQTLTLSPGTGQALMGIATFSNVQAGTYPLSATYSGDSNYQRVSDSGLFTLTVVPSAGSLVSTATVATESSSAIVYNAGSAEFTVTVTGANGSHGSPTGTVVVYANGEGLSLISLTPSGPNTATGTSSPVGAYGQVFNFGLNQITAVYTGDSVYQESVSAPISLTETTTAVSPDFTLAPQLSQIKVQSGSSTIVGINLAPQFGFSSTVTLTCAPSSTLITCSVNPSTLTVNGQTTATLTINAAAQAAGLIPTKRQRQSGWPVAGMLACCLLLVGGRAHRALRRTVSLSLCLFAALLTISCGGSSTSITPTPPPTPTPTLVPYGVVVTGTSSGLVHNAEITVVIP